ncbi:MAG TPA: hypothetical protein DCM86_16435 [Verrucomicrobiales bacterium]|nr:hypothetical protein [Verrucomicrobiales bacterium]
MGWLKRKKDPISERARELSRQIRQLESQIETLSAREESASLQRDREAETPAPQAAPSSNP